jgi:subtilisin-like proprotein convertase family protein
MRSFSPAQLSAGGLYAYTAINAPRGLNERIYHVWRHDGREVDRIALDIQGGRKEGYRAWSHKQNFPAEAQGRWQVQVLTEAGQLIGVLRFDVADAPGT